MFSSKWWQTRAKKIRCWPLSALIHRDRSRKVVTRRSRLLSLEVLETRNLLAAPTVYEQYQLFLINEMRANPGQFAANLQAQYEAGSKPNATGVPKAIYDLVTFNEDPNNDNTNWYSGFNNAKAPPQPNTATFLGIMNAYKTVYAKNGLGPLAFDPILKDHASVHNQWMDAPGHGQFHTPQGPPHTRPAESGNTPEPADGWDYSPVPVTGQLVYGPPYKNFAQDISWKPDSFIVGYTDIAQADAGNQQQYHMDQAYLDLVGYVMDFGNGQNEGPGSGFGHLKNLMALDAAVGLPPTPSSSGSSQQGATALDLSASLSSAGSPSNGLGSAVPGVLELSTERLNEIGLAFEFYPAQDLPAGDPLEQGSTSTHDLVAREPDGQGAGYVTGVVYNPDPSGNYSPLSKYGGIGGVQITAKRQDGSGPVITATTAASSGGYSLWLPEGLWNITYSSPALVTPQVRPVKITTYNSAVPGGGYEVLGENKLINITPNNFGLTGQLPTDPYAPDNTPTTAHDLGSATPAVPLQDQTSLLPVSSATDVHWFSFEMGASGGQGDHVAMDFDRSVGNLQVDVFKKQSDGTLVQVTTGITQMDSGEYIDLYKADAGTYYLKVSSANGATNAYSIESDISFNGVFYYQAPNGTPSGLTLETNRDNLQLVDTTTNAVLLSQLLASTDYVEIEGAANQNATLTVDFSAGNPIPTDGLIFDGGSDSTTNNRLVLRGGSFSNEVYSPSGAGDGTITLDGSTIAFSNLRPIDDTVAANTYTINGTAASEPINIIDHIGLVNGVRATEVNSGSTPTFELVNFANKRNVIVNGVGGEDTFTINNPKPASGLASLTINGSDAGNTFNVQALAVPTIFNTGNGANTLRLSDANLSMAEITKPLTINGQRGTNTLYAYSDKDFTLTDSSLTSGAVDVAISSIHTAILTSESGNTTFDVSGWSGDGGLVGQSGFLAQNVVKATNDGDFVLSDAVLTRTGRGDLALQDIQEAQLTGGPGDNQFEVLFWSGRATLDGKGGNNTFIYGAGLGFSSVQLLDTAKSGIDSALIGGTNAGDTFNVTPTQLTYGLNTVKYDETLDKLSVNGGSASDAFNVTPSTTATFILDGGAPLPPASPGDTLNLDVKGSTGAFRTATPTASGYQGSWTFANRQPVNFTHMETLAPALHLSGAGTPINGFEYSALNGTLAAKFTNADFLVPASDFVASIDWGDGTVTLGSITLSGNTYLLRGSHTYTDESIYTVKVTVSGDLTSANFTTSATMLEQLLSDGTRGTPNQRFISELFRDLLQRPVDQGSLNFWNNLLNLGLPQTFVVLGIESTPEYRQLQVQSLYQRYLHRQPDSFELSLDTNFLLAGGTPEQLAMYLVSTPEFFFQQGAGSLTGYLSAFYHDALQSPVLADVEMADMMQMAQGASLSDIVQEVLHQPDYQQGVVNDLVLSLLDRNPTGTETSNLSLALEMGLTDDDVLALLATTTPYQEYFNKTAS